MEWLDSVPEALRGFAVLGFVLAGAAYAIWSSRRGAREGEPKVQEFAMAGQLADMGPIKELVEGVGLLIQQQVRANIHLEAHTKKQGQTAIAMQSLARHVGRLADSYEARLEAEKTQDEIEKQAQALFERRLANERDSSDEREERDERVRGRPPRKPTS